MAALYPDRDETGTCGRMLLGLGRWTTLVLESTGVDSLCTKVSLPMVFPVPLAIRQLVFAPVLLLLTRFADALDDPWALDDPFLAD
jgi:hypothetical protein